MSKKNMGYAIVLLMLLITTIFFGMLKVSNSVSNSKILLILVVSILGIFLSFLPDNKKINDLIEIIVFSCTVFIILLMTITFFIFRSKVIGRSMDPTLKNGETLYIYQFNYNPKINDIVVYDLDKEVVTDDLIIKRVIALKGDLLGTKDYESNDGKVGVVLTINNEIYFNKYNEVYYLDTNQDELYKLLKTDNYMLGENEVILLGDNSNNSNDSRLWGIFSLDNIVGKALGKNE